jgi:hypothetical protein
MSRSRILVGAVVAIILLLTVPVVGALFVAACLIVGLILWATEQQPRSRPCPVCGEPVPNGVTACTGCGHDFRVAASS